MVQEPAARDARVTYPPLGTLKPVAENIWIVDGPAIRFGPRGFRMAFPTRMTIIRLAGDGLFIHSPIALSDSLRAEVAALGVPRWIIGPNRIHYWWVPEWRQAYPEAEVYLAPRIREQAGGRIDFDGQELDARSGYPWDDALATLPVTGSYMTEATFFHRPSRSLVLTDFIENFEAEKIGSRPLRWLVKAGGSLDPDGSMPRDMRLSYSRHKAELRAAVECMIGWNPERIILAHGRWYDRDGAAELRRAFRWLLK